MVTGMFDILDINIQDKLVFVTADGNLIIFASTKALDGIIVWYESLSLLNIVLSTSISTILSVPGEIIVSSFILISDFLI